MGKTIAKWTVLILLMGYAVVMAVWSRGMSRTRVCTGIDVNIETPALADSLTWHGVMAQLDRYPSVIVGKRIYEVNTLDIENWLRALDSFENVECVMSSKGRLTVNITPMIPEVRVFDGAQSYYLNKAGKRINSKADFFVDVPIVSGRFSKKFPATMLFPVTRFVQQDALLKDLVTMVSAKDPDNILLIPRIGGHVINIGDTTRLVEKRRAIETAYRRILPYKGWETYDTINVKFKGMVVAVRRDKTPLHPEVIIDDQGDADEQTLPTASNQNQDQD